MKNFFLKIASFFKNEKNSIIKPTVVLLCICIIVPLALSITNEVTKGRIAKLEKQAATKTMSELVKADKFIEQNDTKLNITYYEAIRDNHTVALIFTTSAKGYGGDVKVMTAISPDGKIINLAILDASNETPGLGQNVTKESFYSQFIDKYNELKINDIDVVTSATYSSKAVMNSVNSALESFKKLTPKAETSETTKQPDEETESTNEGGAADEK